jgi:hypothetical protein
VFPLFCLPLVYVKVKLSLCFIKHHAMKMHGGADVELHAFLDLTLGVNG